MKSTDYNRLMVPVMQREEWDREQEKIRIASLHTVSTVWKNKQMDLFNQTTSSGLNYKK